MISLQNISVEFGGETLFKNVSFQIKPKDKIGLAGKNGAGKTTLLKIITGLLSPSGGTVALPKECTIGYLPQDVKSNTKRTVIEEAKQAFVTTQEIAKQMDLLDKEIQKRQDYESADYLKLIEQLTDKQHQFQMLDGYNIEEKTEKVLLGLGFTRSKMQMPMQRFSGGWQMRVELAKLLLQKPQVLLLDEPTNHLDIESIIWLEDFLQNFEGAVMLISHDKTFLDKITRRTIEITNKSIEDYKANYSKYLNLRKERRLQLENASKNQQKEIKRIEQNIEKFRYKASKATFAQSLIKRLDRIDKIELDEEDLSQLNIRFPKCPKSGKTPVKGSQIGKTYDNNRVFSGFDITVERGDKIAFVGKNGTGKTTLSKILCGQLSHEGRLEEGYRVHMGYYAQHQSVSLNNRNTVEEEMHEVADSPETRMQIRSILGAFLFSGDAAEKQVKVLSGGEKARLALAKLLLQPKNFLILDEPTNHLDIQSKAVLKQALQNFDGTFIVVSHDRDFLSGLTNRVIEFTDDKIQRFLGTFEEFLTVRNLKSMRELESGANTQSNKIPTTANGEVKSMTMRENQRKKQNSDIKKLKNKIQRTEAAIEKLEKELKDMDEKLRDPEIFKQLKNNTDFFNNYEKTQKDSQHLWDELTQCTKELQQIERDN